MSVAVDYKKEIMDLTRYLSKDELKELIDFARFLKDKEVGFTYTQVKDSAEYIRDLRIKEGGRVRSGKKFIKELIEWQKSAS